MRPPGTASTEVNPDLCVSAGPHLPLIPYLDVTEIGAAARQLGVLPREKQLGSQQITRSGAVGRFPQKRHAYLEVVSLNERSASVKAYVTESTPLSRLPRGAGRVFSPVEPMDV